MASTASATTAAKNRAAHPKRAANLAAALKRNLKRRKLATPSQIVQGQACPPKLEERRRKPEPAMPFHRSLGVGGSRDSAPQRGN